MTETNQNYNMPTNLKYQTIKAYNEVLNDYKTHSDYDAEQLLNMQNAIYLLKEDISNDIKNLFDVEEVSDLELIL